MTKDELNRGFLKAYQSVQDPCDAILKFLRDNKTGIDNQYFLGTHMTNLVFFCNRDLGKHSDDIVGFRYGQIYIAWTYWLKNEAKWCDVCSELATISEYEQNPNMCICNKCRGVKTNA